MHTHYAPANIHVICQIVLSCSKLHFASLMTYHTLVMLLGHVLPRTLFGYSPTPTNLLTCHVLPHTLFGYLPPPTSPMNTKKSNVDGPEGGCSFGETTDNQTVKLVGPVHCARGFIRHRGEGLCKTIEKIHSKNFKPTCHIRHNLLHSTGLTFFFLFILFR